MTPYELSLERRAMKPYPPHPIPIVAEPVVPDPEPPINACESCGVAIWGPGWCGRCNRAVEAFCD